MKIFEWRMPTDSETAKRRAGGRRRYNAMRRRRVDARRLVVAEAVARMGWFAYMARGLRTSLAAQLGVSPSTISRDLRYLLFGGTEYTFHNPEGEFLFSVVREYPGPCVATILGFAQTLNVARVPKHMPSLWRGAGSEVHQIALF